MAFFFAAIVCICQYSILLFFHLSINYRIVTLVSRILPAHATMTRKGDDDKHRDRDSDSPSPFANLDKSAVIQSTRHFNDSPLSTSTCREALSRLLYLFSQGDVVLTRSEATQVFFNAVKLFQSNDIVLRRLLYIILKELANSADDILIAINSLAKDVNGKNDIYRAAAMRTLVVIADAQLLGPIDRYLKQAVVDRSSLVASSALVCGAKLYSQVPDTIRRWMSEVTEATSSSSSSSGSSSSSPSNSGSTGKSPMVQYHALAVLRTIKGNDVLAVQRMVLSLAKTMPKTSPACMLLCKYASDYLDAAEVQTFLEQCMRSRNDPVALAACQTALAASNATPYLVSTALSVLALYLASSKPYLRLAALRTLESYKGTIATIATELEALVSDSNKAIGTMAIKLLLKIASESNVERLLSSVAQRMGELSDESKTAVVHATGDLLDRLPTRERPILATLGVWLTDEPAYDVKRAVVSILGRYLAHKKHQIQDNTQPPPSSASAAAAQAHVVEMCEKAMVLLCECIEDCEYPNLVIDILYMVSTVGPQLPNPSRYVRYIYNRLQLENAAVRASAISALGRFAMASAVTSQLRTSLIRLLQRCFTDADDEVRDRAILYIGLLNGDIAITSRPPILDAILESKGKKTAEEQMRDRDRVDMQQTVGVTAPLTHAEGGHKTGKQQDGGAVSGSSSSSMGASPASSAGPTKLMLLDGAYESLVCSVPARLTDASAEYLVHAIVHLCPQHYVVQYVVRNTVPSLLLRDVDVAFAPRSAPSAFQTSRIDRLAFSDTPSPVERTIDAKTGELATSYDMLRRILASDASVARSSVYLVLDRKLGDDHVLDCKLKYLVKEADDEDEEGGDEDEYALNTLEIGIGNSFAPVPSTKGKDMSAKEKLAAEVRERLELSAMRSCAHAAQTLRQMYGGMVVETMDAAQKQALVVLRGWHEGSAEARIEAKLVWDEKRSTVVMDLRVTADSEPLARRVADAIA
jgi:coatomer protein complex subunit gamma